MNMKKNLNGWCKLLRSDIEPEKPLSDAEIRLYYLYLRIVGWDRRNTEKYGLSAITVRELKATYLPNWSIGKINETQNKLIDRGWLKRSPDGSVEVCGYKAYSLPTNG